MRVALVHDCLREYGDAERTLRVLHRLYPTAPVYTAFVDYQRLGSDRDRVSNWDIRPTFAQHLPGISSIYQSYRSWLPYFWESLDLSSYDMVISSSGDYLSQSVLTRAATLHVSYCHTPPRYLWEPFQSASMKWKGWINTGSEATQLQRLAGSNVRFLGAVPDD